jgi:hypothetical protein
MFVFILMIFWVFILYVGTYVYCALPFDVCPTSLFDFVTNNPLWIFTFKLCGLVTALTVLRLLYLRKLKQSRPTYDDVFYAPTGYTRPTTAHRRPTLQFKDPMRNYQTKSNRDNLSFSAPFDYETNLENATSFVDATTTDPIDTITSFFGF